MYFIVYKKNEKFERASLPNSTSWEEVTSRIEGTLVELFQNDNLDQRSFDEYFFSNYRNEKRSKKNENKTRRFIKV